MFFTPKRGSMIDISGRLYISTVEDAAAELAREYGLGLEIAEFCTAFNMDTDFETWDDLVKRQMRGVSRFLFHAPFNELCPAAVDSMIAGVAKKRYAQAAALMNSYGINAMVVHSGFMSVLYHETGSRKNRLSFGNGFFRISLKISSYTSKTCLSNHLIC